MRGKAKVTRGFIDGEYQDGEIRGINLLLGMRGMGKTSLADRLLSACTGGVIFFDTLSKHAAVLQGYKVISQPGELRDYLELNRGRRFHVLYQPRTGNLDQHFKEVCTIVQVIGWMIFCVDELDKLCGPRWGDARMCPELYELVNYGRHFRVSMIATARRPSRVAAGYRDEAELRIFRLKADVAESIKGDIGETAVNQVVKLPKFFYLHCVEDSDPVLCGGPHDGSSQVVSAPRHDARSELDRDGVQNSPLQAQPPVSGRPVA